MKAKKTIFILLVIVFLGSMLRFICLDKNSLWFDEGNSVLVVSRFMFTEALGGNPDLSKFLRADHQGLLYYPLLYFWARLFGVSVFALRSFSAAAGIVAIVLLFFLGRLLFSEKEALWAAFILGVSPLHLWYSQELRGYSLSATLTLASITCLVAALKKDRIFYWLGFILFAQGALWTNNHMSLILLSVAGLLTAKEWTNKRRKFLIYSGIILLCFLPYAFLIFFPQAKIVFQGINWRQKPTLSSLLFTFFEFNLGYNSPWILYCIFGIIIVAIFFINLRTKSISAEKWEKLIIIGNIISFPIIVSLIISQITPIYTTRYFLPVLPLYCLFIGVLIANVISKHRWMIILLFVLALVRGTIYYYQNYYEENYLQGDQLASRYIVQGEDKKGEEVIDFFHAINRLKIYKFPFHHGIQRKDDDLEKIADIFNEQAKTGDIVLLSHPSLLSTACFYGKHYTQEWRIKKWIPYLGKNKTPIKPLFIPGFFALIEKHLADDQGFAWLMMKGSAWPTADKRLFLDRGDLGKVNFKRVWLLVSSWQRADDYDLVSLSVKKWCDENLRKIQEKKIGNEGIILYKNPK